MGWNRVWIGLEQAIWLFGGEERYGGCFFFELVDERGDASGEANQTLLLRRHRRVLMALSGCEKLLQNFVRCALVELMMQLFFKAVGDVIESA